MYVCMYLCIYLIYVCIHVSLHLSNIYEQLTRVGGEDVWEKKKKRKEAGDGRQEEGEEMDWMAIFKDPYRDTSQVCMYLFIYL